jgi:hypothetical protein
MPSMKMSCQLMSDRNGLLCAGLPWIVPWAASTPGLGALDPREQWEWMRHSCLIMTEVGVRGNPRLTPRITDRGDWATRALAKVSHVMSSALTASAPPLTSSRAVTSSRAQSRDLFRPLPCTSGVGLLRQETRFAALDCARDDVSGGAPAWVATGETPALRRRGLPG